MKREEIVLGSKILQIILIIVATMLVFFFLVRTDSGLAGTIETVGTQFGISVFPSSGLFENTNLSPGDQITQDLSIKNVGQFDFTYNVTSNLESEDDLLYSALELEIKQGEKVLYNGKLKDLTDVNLGVIQPLGVDILECTVRLPIDCGNEYQGKSANVTFILTAEGHPSSLEGGYIDWDPPLEKSDIHVSKGRIMPIRFHIIKDGNYDTVERGIDLVIAGISPTGQPVTYTINSGDNTLVWDSQLQKPHYEMLLDTDMYPIKYDTYYTAVVKLGDQELGRTSFVRGR